MALLQGRLVQLGEERVRVCAAGGTSDGEKMSLTLPSAAWTTR